MSPEDRERAAREIIRKCNGRGWRIGADGSLEVLPTHRGLVPEPTDEHREILRSVLPEVLSILRLGPAPPRPAETGRPAQAGAEPTVDMLRRLAGPCGPEAVEAAARKLAEDLDDHASINYHRKRLAEVRDGALPLKVVLAALRSSAGSGVSDRRKVFANFVEAGREGA